MFDKTFQKKLSGLRNMSLMIQYQIQLSDMERRPLRAQLYSQLRTDLRDQLSEVCWSISCNILKNNFYYILEEEIFDNQKKHIKI